MNPSEEEIAVLIGDAQAPVYSLTIDAFLKFQLKRKVLGQGGTQTFLKQSRSLIQGIANEKMDDLCAVSVRYAKYELDTNPIFQKNFDEEPRAIVLADLVNALKKLADEHISAPAKAEADK